jgi:hypothetical protein
VSSISRSRTLCRRVSRENFPYILKGARFARASAPPALLRLTGFARLGALVLLTAPRYGPAYGLSPASLDAVRVGDRHWIAPGSSGLDGKLRSTKRR